MKPNTSYIEIRQAIILKENLYLMQLRDFKPNIIYPGHWSFFTGHWKNNETAKKAMMRELPEELRWQPKSLIYLGNLIGEWNHQIHVHKCQLDVSIGVSYLIGIRKGKKSVNLLRMKSLGIPCFLINGFNVIQLHLISAIIFQHFI